MGAAAKNGVLAALRVGGGADGVQCGAAQELTANKLQCTEVPEGNKAPHIPGSEVGFPVDDERV